MPLSYGRCSYMARCRKASFDGGSPASKLPLESSLEILAGSRRPSEAFVGVMSQPSARRTLRLPLLPAVRPRLNSDSPVATICSRIVDSFMALDPTLSQKSLRFRSFPTSTRELDALRPHSPASGSPGECT